MTPVQHGDERGVFLEWFREDAFTGPPAARSTLAQANCSVSRAGTVRGIHFAELPPSQAKFVTCVHGAVARRRRRPAGRIAHLRPVGRGAARRPRPPRDLPARGPRPRRSWRSRTARSSPTCAPRCTHPTASTASTRSTPRSASTGPPSAATARPIAPLLSPRDDAAPTLAEVRELRPCFADATSATARCSSSERRERSAPRAGARALSGSHQARLARYHSTVSASPCANGTCGSVAELGADLGDVDGVAQVVAQPVGDAAATRSQPVPVASSSSPVSSLLLSSVPPPML